jgi:hypothetical protein
LKIRPLAICTADFPDDSVETEDGKGFLDHGGRNVAEALGEILSRLGCTTSPPWNAGMYGWRFDGDFHGRTFMCQVSSIPPEFYLHFEGVLFRQTVSPGGQPPVAELIVDFNSELARDGRFHDVLWYPHVRGAVRLEEGVGDANPLATAPAPSSITQLGLTPRLALFVMGGFALLEAVASLFARPSVGSFAAIALGATLLLAAAGAFTRQWPWPSSSRAAATGDQKAPAKPDASTLDRDQRPK